MSGAVVCVDRALYGLHPKLGNELMEYLAAHVIGVAPVPLSGNEKLCSVPSGLSVDLGVRDTLLLRGLDKQTRGSRSPASVGETFGTVPAWFIPADIME